MRADIEGALTWLREHDGGDRVAMVGVSVGGHFAYYAASEFPLALTVALYPTFLTDTKLPLGNPEPTLELTGGITGRMQVIVGDRDEMVTAEQRRLIADRLAAERIRHEVVTVPDAPHAFLNPYAPTYHPTAVDEAWRHIEQALADELGGRD